LLVGIVGKPNCGKTTFLNAACLTTAKVGDYPFTTIEPNPGTAYVRVKCACKDLNVTDNPKNSICLDGIRLIPIELLDVAGLVPGAWEGKGLGNKFLDDLRRADVLIHVVDASGSTNAEGQPVEAGSWDPIEDVKFLEHEIIMWFVQILQRDWKKFTRKIEQEKLKITDALAERLSGLGITRVHVMKAQKNAKIDGERPSKWSEEDLVAFATELRKIAKPMIILANKADAKTSEQNIKRLQDFSQEPVIPACTLGEFFLRQFAEQKKIEYQPGASSFKILDESAFSAKEKGILENLQALINKFGSTGVQAALDTAVFDILKMIPVFPVHDVSTLADKDGNVLPDAYLIPEGTTIRQFAGKIHTDFAKTFIHGIDARTKKRIGEDHVLKSCDVVKIVSAK